METKDLSNQTPEQANTPEKEENTVSEPKEKQENEKSSGVKPENEAGNQDEGNVKDAEPEQVSRDSSPDEKTAENEKSLPADDPEEDKAGEARKKGEPEDTGLSVPDAIATQAEETEPETGPETEKKPETEAIAEAETTQEAEQAPESEPEPEAETTAAAQQAEEEVVREAAAVSETESSDKKDTEEKGIEPEVNVKSPDVAQSQAADDEEAESENSGESTGVSPGDEPADDPKKTKARQADDKKEKAATQDEVKSEHADEEDEDEEEEEREEIYQNLSRAELVDLIEKTVQEEDVQAIKVRVSLIKVAYLEKEKEEQQTQYDSFVKDGGVPENYSPAPDQLSERFQMAFNIYREKKQRYNEDLEKEKLVNLEEKKKILEELRVLISSEETLKKTYDEFKELQDQWKQIGMVPKNEINQLWQNYHFLVEKFFDKVKINKELKDLDLKKNLERKIDLCEKAEELLIETSIIKSFKQLQQYHEEWKEIGPVPQDKKDEIWERFKTASDQINERRREYYNKKQGEFESNYLAKTALCEKAEKLISQNPETLRQWQNRTHDINELMRVWKTIGPAPKKVNNEIWARFKSCLDTHFTSYKEFLARLKDQQLNNYNLKLDLCAQTEAIKNSTDWRNTTQDLIKLQREWKEIGPVPRKHSDKIWKRFRAACDEFFKNKSEYFSNLAEVEESNMKMKEDLIKKLNEVEFSDNRSENLETLKNFQREWLEIGHVPIKEKDRLQNAFRVELNKHFAKLKIDAAEVNALSYKNRLESIREKPDAGRVIHRERGAMQNKISKLQEDILLWENNIGFLAESKNANIVKVEFQKKIDQAKQELALMEAKLRYLKEI
jgi:hypothetical protein